MQWIAPPMVIVALLATPMVAFAQEFNTYDPYGQSFDTDYTSPTWQPSAPSPGGGSSGGSTGSTGGTASGSTGGTATATIPAGAVAVTLNGGKGPVYYRDSGKEEKNAVGDWTLMKIYARSPLGIANYTQSIGVITSKKEGASYIYGDGYIYPDKLEAAFPRADAVIPSPPVTVPTPPAAAPTPPPAKPIPPAPTNPPLVPAAPAAPAPAPRSPASDRNEVGETRDDVQPVTASPPSPSEPRASALRRIARGINSFFGSMVRWFQHFGR